MRILIYGSTYLTEKCVNRLLKDGYNLIGYIPSVNPTFPGKINLPEVTENIEHDIKLSIQYDKKIENTENAYNLHTGLLPEYGGCSILYHTLQNKETEQGLTFHKMSTGFDNGGIISKITYPVIKNDNVTDLYFRMCSIAPKFISNALGLINIVGKSYTPKLYKKSDVPDDISIYDKESISLRLKKNNCKIITVCFKGDRDVRTNVSYPAHNQDSPTSEHMLQMVKDLYELEIKQDAGCPLDIYFVNSDVGFKEGNDWLNSIAGTGTKNGHIFVLTRENIGGSFASYDFAFQVLKNDYEYFLFTEEDLFILGKDYYQKAIDKFEEEKLGFLSFIGVERRRNPVHAHGGVGLTTRSVLNEVCEIHGSLPHSKIDFDKQDAIRNGEIPFTNKIHKLGYELANYGHEEDWDINNNIIPYYVYKS